RAQRAPPRVAATRGTFITSPSWSHSMHTETATQVALSPPMPTAAARPGRLWPAVVFVALFWTVTLGIRSLEPVMFVLFVGRLGAALLLDVAMLVWWSRFRGVSRRERWAFLGWCLAGALVVAFLGHKSMGGLGIIWTGLMMGLPFAFTAATAWLVLTR